MPTDRVFNKGALVASLMYLLGLDREPEDETRSPRVVWGDPALCAELESSNRLENSSTNLVISFYEWLSDREAEEISHELVEDHLLVGVPKDDYVYSSVAHDEEFRPEFQKKEASGRKKRTAVHIKIINLRLPNGGFLQPFYPKRERMFMTLYLTDLAVRKNLGSPLDPGRPRNFVDHHRHGDIHRYKRLVDEAVKSAKRLPDGTPDPEAVLMKFSELGHKEVFATTGLHGRQGVFVKLDGHPLPVRFFGAGFEELYQLISKKEGTTNEYTRSNKYGPGEEFFPRGYLNRAPEYTSRIATALREWRTARAAYHIRKYDIGRPTMVFGGFTVGADPGPFCGVGRADYLAMEPKQGVEGPIGGQVFDGDCQPDCANASNAAIVDASTSSTPNSYEFSKPGKSVTHERHSDPRGTHEDLGISLAAIAADAARIFRAIHVAIQGLHGAIRAVIGGRSQGTQDLADAGQELDVESQHLDEASRHLDATIGRRSLEAGDASVELEIGDEEELGTGDLIRRVRRQLPTPRPGPQPSLEQ